MANKFKKVLIVLVVLSILVSAILYGLYFFDVLSWSVSPLGYCFITCATVFVGCVFSFNTLPMAEAKSRIAYACLVLIWLSVIQFIFALWSNSLLDLGIFSRVTIILLVVSLQFDIFVSMKFRLDERFKILNIVMQCFVGYSFLGIILYALDFKYFITWGDKVFFGTYFYVAVGIVSLTLLIVCFFIGHFFNKNSLSEYKKVSSDEIIIKKEEYEKLKKLEEKDTKNKNEL